MVTNISNNINSQLEAFSALIDTNNDTNISCLHNLRTDDFVGFTN